MKRNFWSQMKRSALSAFLFLTFMLLLPVVSSQGAEFRIGVLYWSMSIPGQVAMRKGLEAEAEKINREAVASGLPSVRLEVQVAGDGADGIEKQIEQMRAMIASRVDLIIVQPTDNAALAMPLREANKAAIPVVAYDQYIAGGKLAAYRTSDNYQAGYLDGEYIASRFASDREIQLVLVEYPHVSSTVERVNGFLDALAEAKRHYKILKSYQAVEPESGRKAAEAILRDFPTTGTVDVVFTVNDGGGLNVVRGLAGAGRTEILVATIDGDPDSIENIKAGRLTIIDSAQFCGPLGAEAMRAAYQLLSGGAPPHHALVPTFPVTKETLEQFPGWMGPVRSEFKKPWEGKARVWRGELKVVSPKGK